MGKYLYELNDSTFDGQVSSGKHLINFMAAWCRYSQELAPKFKQLSNSPARSRGSQHVNVAFVSN